MVYRAPAMAKRPQWWPAGPELPGLGLAAVIGAVAVGLAHVLPPSPIVSDVLIALVLGAVLLNSPARALLRLELPSSEREPDRYAAGLRFTGKWVLRLGIVLMGLKVQTSFFGASELLLIAGVAAAAVPSVFFLTHALATSLGLRRAMADLLAGGTMICGASAINAIAPVAGGHRQEQGLAIGVVFLFSVVALIVFHPIAAWVGLSPAMAGLWSGLAVNDLSSAVAVGSQMGEPGGVMAAAAKSFRVLLLAPTLIALALLRRAGGPAGDSGARQSLAAHLPGFLLGYIGLALVRAAGDRLFGAAPAWTAALALDGWLVDLLMATVAAGIGLHLALRALLVAGTRSLLVGAGASLWMAGLTLAMISAIAQERVAFAALIGGVALFTSYTVYRVSAVGEAELRALRRRFDSGAPLSLAEATRLLDAVEHSGGLDDALLRRLLEQLHPSIGELIPVRESPLPHGEGCRWVTYWQGRSGWALVAICREAGSATPIHAHPHRLIGKAIEGVLEELRFRELPGGELEVVSRALLGHNDLVETDGLATLHLVRAAGPTPAIDLQLRGPECGSPGRLLRTRAPLELDALRPGMRLAVREEVDDRPGQGGEGAAAGLQPAAV
jgi:uncharacterized integral membrane protein (TIGR00698 family)